MSQGSRLNEFCNNLDSFFQEFFNKKFIEEFSFVMPLTSDEIKKVIAKYINDEEDEEKVKWVVNLLSISTMNFFNFKKNLPYINAKKSLIVVKEITAIEQVNERSANVDNMSLINLTIQLLTQKRSKNFFTYVSRNHRCLKETFLNKSIGDIINDIPDHSIPKHFFSSVVIYQKDENIKKQLPEIIMKARGEKGNSLIFDLDPEFYHLLTLDELSNGFYLTPHKFDLISEMIKKTKEAIDEEEECYLFMRYIFPQLQNYYFSDQIAKLIVHNLKALPFCPLLNIIVNQLTHEDYSLNEGEDRSILEENDNFNKYFSCEYYFEEEFDDLAISFYLNTINGEFLTNFNYYHIEDRYEIIDSIPNLGDKERIANCLRTYIEEHDPKYQKEKEKRLKKIENKRKNFENAMLLLKVHELRDLAIESLNSSLSSDFLVDVIPVFESYNGKMTLFLKVGSVRYYMVSNIGDFLDRFINKDYFKYGNKLAFVHKKENLVEGKRDFINSLCSLPNLHLISNKKLLIPIPTFIYLLNTLKGERIYLDDNYYDLVFNEIELPLHLDSDFVLSLKESHYQVIYAMNQYLIFDTKNHIVNKLKDNEIINPLLANIIEKGEIDLKPVKDQFISDLLPFIHDDIKMEEEIKSKIDHDRLVIDSYFSFDDKGAIEVNTKLYRDGEQLKNIFDVDYAEEKLLNLYDELLIQMGFDKYVMDDEEKIFNFLTMDLSPLKKISNVYLSSSLANKKIRTFTPPKIRLSLNNQMMQVFYHDSEYTEDELQRIYTAIKKKKNYVLLKSDQIVKLNNDQAKKFYSFVDGLNLDYKHLLKEQDRPLYYSFNALDNLSPKEVDDKLKEMVEDIRSFKKQKFTLPKLITSLKPYQKEGFNWMKVLSKYSLGGILADDMGLGKTLQTIALILSEEHSGPSLVVTPKSLVFNWLNEFEKFTNFKNVHVIVGQIKEREALISQINDNDDGIYLVSYETLRNDIDLYDQTFNYLILDEAQAIKNAYALKSQCIKKIKAKHRFALTGTPIENDIFDLWSIFDFLMPGYLPSLATFNKRGSDEDFLLEISNKVTPFILRRTKKDVLKELPEKFERVITCEMSEEQRKIYDAFCLNARKHIERKEKFFALESLIRLRQICVDPMIVDEKIKNQSSKMKLLFKIIDEYINNHHRMLIFSSFLPSFDIIEEYLKEKKIKYFKITGATKAKERVDYTTKFNQDDRYKVFLISLKAGGHGLNLTGADTVIHLDPWWNASSENQATDRAHRIGQEKRVEVIKLITENSVEQRVIELQRKKKDLIDKMIENDTKALEKITLEDLSFLVH